MVDAKKKKRGYCQRMTTPFSLGCFCPKNYKFLYGPYQGCYDDRTRRDGRHFYLLLSFLFFCCSFFLFSSWPIILSPGNLRNERRLHGTLWTRRPKNMKTGNKQKKKKKRNSLSLSLAAGGSAAPFHNDTRTSGALLQRYVVYVQHRSRYTFCSSSRLVSFLNFI